MVSPVDTVNLAAEDTEEYDQYNIRSTRILHVLFQKWEEINIT